MLGFLIALVFFLVGVYYYLTKKKRFDTRHTTGYMLIMASLFLTIINIMLIDILGGTSSIYEFKLWERIDDFHKFSVESQIEYIERFKEYEQWRTYSLHPLSNNILFDWYFSDDAKNAPAVNINELYRIMECSKYG